MIFPVGAPQICPNKKLLTMKISALGKYLHSQIYFIK